MERTMRRCGSMLVVLLLGCEIYDGPCEQDDDCESGFSCRDGACLKGPGAAGADGGGEGEGEGGGSPGDLVVTTIKVLDSGAATQSRDLRQRGDYTFCGVMKNAGPGAVAAPDGTFSFRWIFDGDAKPVAAYADAATRDKTISVGEQWESCTMMQLSGWDLGGHEAKFVVNPDGKLLEANQGNNEASMSFRVVR